MNITQRAAPRRSDRIVRCGTILTLANALILTACDPVTGSELWMFDAHVDRAINPGDFASRGVTAWTDPTARPGATCAMRAYDVATGRESWRAQLPAGARATPMTYVSASSKRQYVVVSAGAATNSVWAIT